MVKIALVNVFDAVDIVLVSDMVLTSVEHHVANKTAGSAGISQACSMCWMLQVWCQWVTWCSLRAQQSRLGAPAVGLA